MAKKNPPPIDTDPFGSYTGVVRFPDKVNPEIGAKCLQFPQAINSEENGKGLSFPQSQNPVPRDAKFRFPDSMNPVQDVDDL